MPGNVKFSMTRQRRVILEELRKVTSHPTADEVYQLVRGRLPRISLGTVYRNLEMMSESAIIQKLSISGSQMRFDGNPEEHYHVKCIRCGRVDDLPVEPIKGIEEIVREVIDYKILGWNVEFIGLCPTCKNESQ